MSISFGEAKFKVTVSQRPADHEQRDDFNRIRENLPRKAVKPLDRIYEITVPEESKKNHRRIYRGNELPFEVIA